MWVGMMSELRVWHSSRDAYHCAFRMMRLLSYRKNALPLELLRVLDMYLLYPPLLERMSLPMEIKKRFRSLNLPPIAKMFVRLPGTAAVWQDLQIYQAAAIQQLAGRDLLKRDSLREQLAMLEGDAVPAKFDARIRDKNENQKALVAFLVDDIGSLSLRGPDNLYKRAGLPARGPVL